MQQIKPSNINVIKIPSTNFSKCVGNVICGNKLYQIPNNNTKIFNIQSFMVFCHTKCHSLVMGNLTKEMLLLIKQQAERLKSCKRRPVVDRLDGREAWWSIGSMVDRLFHWTTKCQGDSHTGKNFLPPIKTRSPVVKTVKLMACRQAKSPLKITTWSGVQKSASHIS